MNPSLAKKLKQAKLVVIGASAGGVEALGGVLPPGPIRPAIAVVLHLPAGEKSLLPFLFGRESGPPAREPEDKEPVLPGHLYFAPADYHLLLEAEGTFSLSCDEPANFSRPSIDVLFESAAESYGEHALGIVLSGANDDGSAGLRRILDANGCAVVMAPETAVAPEMPRAALKACPEAICLTLPEIRDLLASLA